MLGIPDTQNIEKNLVLNKTKPIKTIPNQNIKDKNPVMLKWLLIVIEKGIKPIKLLKKINIYIKVTNKKNKFFLYKK